jgi:peroxiredoxin
MMRITFQLLSFVLAVAILTSCGQRAKEESVAEVNDLPVLTVRQVDGQEVFVRGLNGKMILIFFNPDCDHCQNEAKAIAENKRSFEEYQLYFISSDSVQNVQKFASDYNLLEPNYHFSTAEGMDVYNAMGPLPSVPAVFIYNNRKRVKEFLGETKIEELKKFL